jgi:hypothetical protein
LNNKLKDKKKVAMNGILAQLGNIGNKFDYKGGHEESNKFESIISCCFVYNFVEHNIYDCPHKDTTQAMFRGNVATIAPKKDNVVVNMVSIVTTYSQILKNVFKNKSLVD